ncbi:MAG: hypothetical protein AAB017_03905 [Nitrospirota bacterium]
MNKRSISFLSFPLVGNLSGLFNHLSDSPRRESSRKMPDKPA